MDSDIAASVAAKSQLTDHQLAVVASEIQKRAKSTVVAYILWFFVGWIGGHRYYLGRVGSGLLMAALFVLGWITIWMFGLGAVFFGILAIWEIVDAFLIPGMVRANLQLMESRVIAAVRQSR